MPRARPILLLTLAASAPAWARQAGSDVDIVIRDAARQRISPGGAALAAMVDESGRAAGLASAWTDFAAELGWTTTQAFDALLGSRVTLVLRGVTPTGAAEWALVSEVTSDAERRLVAALRPAPRGTAGGLTVLAIERGKYELAIARGGWREGAERPAVILLAPAEDRALFDELVPTLSAPRAGDPDADDAAVTIRRPAAPAFEGGPARTSTITLTARLDADGTGWTCRLLGDARSVAPVTPWSTAAFEGLQGGGLVTVMGVLGAPPLSELGEWFGVPGITLPAGSLVGQRVALVVRGAREHPLAPGLASGAVRLAAHRHAAPSALAVTIAVEARDIPSLIPTADTVSASLVPFLNGERFAPLPAVEFDAGLLERSVRAVELTPGKGSLASGFGASPVFTWAFGRSCASFAQLAGVKTGLPEGSPGWWVMSLAPAEAARTITPTETVRDLLSREMPDPLQMQRLSVGVIRPADLESAPGVPPELSAALRGGRWVESVRWDSWLRPDGRAEGEVRVRMNPRP